jgi:hypothetical protein
MYEITRAALDAANAIVWPGDDDAAPSITDEDDLLKALEAAAPHIASSALAGLRERLVGADQSLRGSVREAPSSMRADEMTRLNGKAEGVRLAMSYLDEMTRGL